MKHMIEAACGCFPGTGREHNEDNFYFNRKHLPVENMGTKGNLYLQTSTAEPVLLAVFDGMGGEARGEEAACRASEVFAEEDKKQAELVIPGKQLLYDACCHANEAVRGLAKERQVGTMGTTVAAIHFLNNDAVACNVGDSKIFRIRNGQMVQISEDHTDERILRAMGVSKKPVLLQYIGIPETEMVVDPLFSKCEILPGDVYILCTDGVTDAVDVQTLYMLASASYDPETVVSGILGCVRDAGGQDNATVIVVMVKE